MKNKVFDDLPIAEIGTIAKCITEVTMEAGKDKLRVPGEKMGEEIRVLAFGGEDMLSGWPSLLPWIRDDTAERFIGTT